MLARTFKTAAELGLQDHEHQALITVLYMAEDGQIKPEELNMSQWHCDTSHCLAGWANTINNEAFPELNKLNWGCMTTVAGDRFSSRLPKPLLRLFGVGTPMKYASFSETIPSLRRYLETGCHT